MRRLYAHPTLGFGELFADQQDRSELVATFLALLELIKGGRVTVSDDGDTVTFYKSRQARADEVTTV